MSNHLFLIGYRGSGKTSIGRRIGEILGLPSVDSDDYIERAAEKSIRAIFSEAGESAFRDLETLAIEQIAGGSRQSVVSLGGGSTLREKNRAIIKANGKTVWLRTSIDEITRRIANDTMTPERRPALTQLAARDEIEKLLQVREPIYAQVADVMFETDDRTIDAVAAEIVAWFSKANRSATSELTS